MKRNMRWTGVVLAAVLLVAPAVQAEVLEIMPTQTLVLGPDAGDTTWVALQFDLSGVDEGQGRRIVTAMLDWPLNGMAENVMTEYAVYAATAAWTPAAEAVTAAEEPLQQWEFTPMDFEALGEGLVRFDIRSLVGEWLAGTTPNHGVVVATADLDADAGRPAR